MGNQEYLGASLILVFILTALWSSQDVLQTFLRSRGDAVVGIPLAADLSGCHPSFTDAGAPTNCCPPRKDADQQVIDFDLSKLAKSRLRIRRPAHLVEEEYIAKYQRAVEKMKSLPSDHPLSFFRQAQNHCLYCTGSYDQANSSSLFKIHRSWLFFPWHRAFIFFHERILGKLIGDDTFALPYWNWDNPEGMMIPGIFTQGALRDIKRDQAHLPPDIADLNFDRKGNGSEPDDLVAVNLAFMYNQMVSGARKPELFLGCKLTAGPKGFCNGPGTVEGAPHNTLHSWVGSRLNPERENMGAFYTAAHDPIFYAHHANIDRLWEVWRDLSGTQVPEFTESAWLDSSFTFYDENLRFVRIKVRDCLDIEKMGYAYEDIDLPWLKAKPTPATPPQLARDLLRKIDSSSRLRMPGSILGEIFNLGDGGRALDSTVTAKLHRSKRGRSKAEKEEAEEVLVVYGIRVKRDTYAKFDVFVNLVADEETAGPLAREFAGSFVNTPRGATRARGETGKPEENAATLKLGISELLDELEADSDESIRVSLVPRGSAGSDITVEGLRIEFLR